MAQENKESNRSQWPLTQAQCLCRPIRSKGQEPSRGSCSDGSSSSPSCRTRPVFFPHSAAFVQNPTPSSKEAAPGREGTWRGRVRETASSRYTRSSKSSLTAGGGGKPSWSSSAIVADTASGYHILRINGYSGTKGTPAGECLKSHPFTIGGYRWFIYYYPNGPSEISKDYISFFFLVLDQSVAKEVKAQFQIRFVDKVGKTPLTSEYVSSFRNQASLGYPKFSKREDLEKSEHLKDDSFAVQCDIIIINNNIRTEETTEAATPAFISVPPSDLNKHLGDLLTEKGSDVVFEVGGQTFAAHRCVLVARSPVFRAELFGTMKESDTTSVVRIDDVEAQVFKALLYFMYTDSLPKTNKEDKEEEEDVMSQHLLVAADRYNLERLKLIGEDKLCKYIDVSTVATILALAEQHHCHGLKKVCFDSQFSNKSEGSHSH